MASIPRTPSFNQPNCVRLLVSASYDGRPLNIGTFVRQIDSDVFLDGVIPRIPMSTIEEVQPHGICAYISSL